MMKRILTAGAALLFLCGADAPPATPPADLAAAFGAREGIEDASLSPDGSKIAYVVPAEGQGGVVYTQAIAPGSPRQIALVATGDPDRVESCRWASNDRLACTIYGIVSSIDLLPFSRIVAVNIDGSGYQMLSTVQNDDSHDVQLHGGDVIDWLPDESGAVLMTRRYIPDDHLGSRAGSAKEGLGVDRIDTRTLAITKVEPPRADAQSYISDGHGTVRVMSRAQTNGETGMISAVTHYFYRTKASRDWKPLDNDPGFTPQAIDYERDAVYGFRKLNGKAALYRKTLDGSDKEELIFARPDVDVDGLVTIGRRNRVVGVSYVTDIRRIVYFDPVLDKLAKALGKALPDQPLVQIVDASQDEAKLLIWAGGDKDPGVYYVFDRTSHSLAVFGLVRPQLEKVALATVKAVSYPAADGTMVPAYLTLPSGGADRKLPAIVLPHGGPASRDEWGFDWLSQYYAARGFAVLQPEFRGSAGYGDAWFKNNGFKSWKVAIGDVLDAGRWLVGQGIADPTKLAVVGWSYGGYAALQSAVVDPTLFKAVVAIAPVTDLASLKEEHRLWNDYYIVSDEVGSGSQIREASPAQNAEKIKAPVLLFHAGYDRNVRFAESRLMDARLKSAGVPHELVTWPKLDHQLKDSAARAAMLRKSEAFLRASMGM